MGHKRHPFWWLDAGRIFSAVNGEGGRMSFTVALKQSKSTEKDPLTEQIIDAAIEVHKAMGPGLLESVYEDCFCHELALRGIDFDRQVPAALSYKGLVLVRPP